MGASEATPTVLLPLFSDRDKPSWRGDFNGAMRLIDGAVTALTSRVADDEMKFRALIINVKDYGARGDGTTDDTTAFVNAGATGRPVYVPGGTYKITAPATTLPAGKFYGSGVLSCTGTGMDGEVLKLEAGTPQPINSQMIGDGHRNSTSIGQNAATVAGSLSGANAVFGANALTTSVKSQRNTAIGSGAMKYTGDYDRPGTVDTNACKNVAVGTDAAFASTWVDSSTYVGSNAGKWTGDVDPRAHAHDFFDGCPTPQMYSIDAANRWPTVRTDAVGALNAPKNLPTNETHNAQNVGVGRNTLLHAVRTANCVAVGYNALAHGYNVSNSVAVGYGALRDGIQANDCVAVGGTALQLNASGIGNTAVGAGALSLNTHAVYNTAIGYSAMQAMTGGLTAPSSSGARRNVAVGNKAMANATAGAFCNGVGSEALLVNTGDANNAVGASSQHSMTSGIGNSALGHQSLMNETTGTYNTALGYNAGVALQGSGAAAVGLTNTTTVGYSAAVSGSNEVQLGNSATSTYAYGAVQNRSDARDKADVQDTALGLDFVEKLRPVDFRWNYREDYRDPETGEAVDNDGSKKRARFHHGLIAQEVQSVIAETGVDFGGFQDHKIAGGSDVLTIGYEELVAPLIKAVQELSARVKELEASR